MKRAACISIFVLLLTVRTAPCASAPREVSMIRLLAAPEQFDGQPIRVCGFLSLQYEASALYLHREDFEHTLLRNAIWVEMPETKDYSNLSMRYVVIEGTFDADNHGHFGSFSGAIKNITHVQLWFEGDTK